jgi:hypothetical protein
VGHSEKVAGETNQILEPHRLESQFGAELDELGRHRLVEEVVAGDDGHRYVAVVARCSESAKKAESVEDRHAQVENNRVRVAFSGLLQPSFGVHRRSYVVSLEAEHPRKRLRDSLIVIDDKNFRPAGVMCRRVHWHAILRDVPEVGHKTKRRTSPPEAWGIHAKIARLISAIQLVGGAYVSPILVRPVREQLEHDRVIRLLQAKSRRRYEAGINPGGEQNAGVGGGTSVMYPDLVLQSPQRGHRLQAVVEVETGESVNHLEALAQWAHFGKLRVPFHLYVPAGMVDVARRLCEDNQIHVSEIWSFHSIGDQVRFTLVHRSREPVAASSRTASPRRAESSPRKRTARAVKGRTHGRAKGAKKPARATKRK